MRIAFLIRSLNAGGAERQLATLARGLKQRGHNVTVLMFYESNTPLERSLVEADVRLVTLGKKGRWDIFGFLYRLYWHLRREPPDILHGYLVVANILVTLMAPLLRGTGIVWGVRASEMDLSHYDWLARATFRLSCWLSHFPDLIIANSEAGRRYHSASGYPPEKIAVVCNGIDTDYFVRDQAAGRSIRIEWGIADGSPLIGLVARLDPIKDHATFLRAAALLISEIPTVRFACVGDGSFEYRTQLTDLTRTLGLMSRITWAGDRTDLPAIYSALDLAVLSSRGEGFPNVLAEAMACGVRVVATDVGDTADIIGSLGTVVPSGDPVQLKEACLAALRAGSTSADQLRERIVRSFSLNHLVETTQALLGKVVRPR